MFALRQKHALPLALALLAAAVCLEPPKAPAQEKDEKPGKTEGELWSPLPNARLVAGGNQAITCVAYARDGRHALSGGEDRLLHLWDLKTLKEVRQFHGHAHWVWSVALSPDGKTAFSGGEDHTARLWEMKTGKELHCFKTNETVSCARFTPDGQFAVATCWDHKVRFWAVNTGKLVCEFTYPMSILDIAFTPESDRFLLGNLDGVSLLCEAATGKVLREFHGHRARVHGVALSPDGKHAVSASHDGTLRLWELESGRALRVFKGHSSMVHEVAYLPDGRHFLSTGEDHTVRLWDVESEEECTRGDQHGSAVRCIALALNGRSALTGSFDGSLRLWPLPDRIASIGQPDKARLGLLMRLELLRQGGWALQKQGQDSLATEVLEQRLTTARQLYPQAKFPDGHPEVATSLNMLGNVLSARAKYAQAESYFREALAMRCKLYPADRYKDGHADLAVGLNNLGSVLQKRGEYVQAEQYFRDALAMRHKLYPPSRYINGNPELARSLARLGRLLQDRGQYLQAEPYVRDALSMNRKLYPEARYPNGHPQLAISINGLGSLLKAGGEYTKAETYYRDALAMFHKLYPPARYPNGHPNLAASLNNLGFALSSRGEYAQAEPYFRETLAMSCKLYPEARYPNGHPEARYPNGHPDLAQGLLSLGVQLHNCGNYAQAEPYYREALAMNCKLYPAARYPDGHPNLVRSLTSLGSLLRDRGEYAQAEPYFRDALAMNRKLYPGARYPNGHPDLARSLNDLGHLLQTRGEYTQAELLYRNSLAMNRNLYPAARYPNGHLNMAVSLINLGTLLQAEPYVRDGLAMSQRLAATFAAASAEAETLNYLASQLPRARDNFLSVTANIKDSSPETTYALLWQDKAALARALERRQRILRQLQDVTIRDQLKELLDTRRQLAQLLLGQDRQDKDRDQRLQTLTQRKEDLEKKLAARVPEVKDAQVPYSDLVDCLAADTAFIDFHRYHHAPRGEMQWRPHYVAFVLRKGAKVVRVELGQAEPIEKALVAWRQAIAAGLESPAAATLRHLIWDKLAAHLPDQPGSTVYLCPDSDLSALPWAALPGRRPGTVLLEDHTLALVPHGHFLLARLRERGQAGPQGPGVLLAVGGVSYDKAAAPVRRADGLADLRRADRSDKQGAWPDLPGTAREAKAVADLARGRKQPPKVLVRDGTQAGPTQLLLDLPQARWAHLATHGFFAAPATGVRKYLLDEKDFLRGRMGERVGVGARNPLTQTGLVLAGANLKGKAAAADGGILTAEGLAGLNLDGLELAVLSACETGLGEAASGEGVFGLQRAFHLGGCRNVVASLWKVDDDATAALMALFYHELWVEGVAPLEALRRAQLALYRHPGAVRALARSRGPDFDQTVRRVTQPPPRGAQPAKRAAVKDWAAFVLSGAGW